MFLSSRGWGGGAWGEIQAPSVTSQSLRLRDLFAAKSNTVQKTPMDMGTGSENEVSWFGCCVSWRLQNWGGDGPIGMVA